MSDFVVSARKYRPHSFETVVGQESITSTLLNSIETGQMAHAYLFCGPRGVGKTSCARIFAKVINQDFIKEGDDLSFNVFELDAASNNSVEDIRYITDQVRIPPQIGKYKVYIIDEVHMLSAQAFNAFLKTLEEPPPHAIFILATTEKHKIIPTILSRCQVYNFSRIKVSDMVSHLEKIADKEGIQYEKEGLYVIAEKADGALRDSLSIFDQIVNFSNRNITYQSVIENLNILDYNYYFKVSEFINKHDISNCLLTFDEILSHGFDGHHFLSGLGSHYRDLLVSKDPATVKLMEVGENIKEKYLSQSQEIDVNKLIKGLSIISESDIQYKTSKNHRLLVELTLIKLCSLGQSEQKKNPVTEGSVPKKTEEVVPLKKSETPSVEPLSPNSKEGTKNSPELIEEQTPVSTSVHEEQESLSSITEQKLEVTEVSTQGIEKKEETIEESNSEPKSSGVKKKSFTGFSIKNTLEKKRAEAEEEALREVQKAGVEIIRPDKSLFAEKVKDIYEGYKDDQDIYPLIKQIQETK
mgnify:CR=1 FL=1